MAETKSVFLTGDKIDKMPVIKAEAGIFWQTPTVIKEISAFAGMKTSGIQSPGK